ncbi:methyltransferase [Propionigenium maris DSM 9537]|uniref:Methyltransferase n=1 Tax=Propionigenium maris DSM 9537 TaxID=1123000 RepID=A0A9W6GNZ4_9FUSO|nr:site-specific DNA-methyltransferase [Propionigenium maris]GLI57344.1 methyltransferase [Propionigenium maris DSM 9537]
MKIEKVNITELVPYANNAKEHPQEQIDKIKASIKEFGFNDPIAIDENNVIIEGHGRLIALQQMGSEVVDVIRLEHLSEVQKKQYILAHNKLTMDTGFNMEMLELEIEAIRVMDGDLILTGFDLDEIKDINLNLSEAIEEIQEDEVPEVDLEREPFSQLGDLWKLGKHKLLCGNSTNQQHVKTLMGNEKAQLVVTDPPYNVNYEGATKEKLTIKNDNMSDSKFYEFLLNSYSRIYESLEDGGGIYVFHADTEGMNFRKAMMEAGFYFAQCCVWVKNSLVMGRQDYQWQHEPILVGWKPGKAHNWYLDRKQTTVWRFDRPVRNDIHPTMKPLNLIAYPIRNSSRPGDIVIDFFGGSGSTLMACEETKRVCRTMELDPRYVDAIVKRYLSSRREDIKLVREGKEISLEEIRAPLFEE